MNKIGTLDIIKAYLGNKELSANNAYIGEIPLIKGSGPEPLDKDYFYLQPLSTGNYSISSSDEVWKQNNTFEFRKDNTNWRKFSSLPTQESSVGFDVYMTNNPDLVALALDINAYNTYVVGKNYRVGISQMVTVTVATFLGTDEKFAYYTGTLEKPENMKFQWGLMSATSTLFNYKSNQSTGRMFEWNVKPLGGTNKNTNISDYSSFSVVNTIITETIPLTANDKLYLRNTSGSIHSGLINSIQSVNYNIGGILNTLTDYTDETYTITESYAENLFKGNAHLISAGDLKLPAISLAGRCYYSMFNSCSSLTEAPALPATSLAEYCYYYMFSGCTSLTEAPALPATSLASSCYISMFIGCTSLTTTPTLPATSLAEYCYYYMFSGCTSLTEAPALPATSLAIQCYYSMFDGCTSLTEAPVLPATTLADDCYSYMFNGCTSLTTAPALPATTLADDCYSYMFGGCTSLSKAPELPATNVIGTGTVNGCYRHMFDGCTSLNKITIYANNYIEYATNQWLNGVSTTGDFYNLGGANYPSGASGIPSGWTEHTSL